MKKRIYLILATSFLLSSNIFCQWNDQSNGLPNWNTAWAIDASDENTVVISVSPGLNPSFLFLTTDAGNNWNGLSFAIVDQNVHEAVDVEIIDKDHIWAAMEDGRIIATTNGGLSWQTQFYDTSKTKFMNYIEMFDANNGIAMGDCNYNNSNSPAIFLKTTNGGIDWVQTTRQQLLGLSSGDTWRRIDFVDSQNGFFYTSGESPQKIYSTSTSGNIWNETAFDEGVQILKFYDDQFGLALNNKEVYKTINGGNSWDTFTIDESSWGGDIEFIPGDPAKVWFTDNRKLYFSADSGKVWHVSGSTIGGRDIVFTDANNGWILCDNGKVYSTANGSGPVVGIEEVQENIPSNFILQQNYPNPFNPNTTIGYQLPENCRISLKIIDILGREVTTLVEDFQEAGYYEKKFDAGNLSSGIYFSLLRSEKIDLVKKMLLVK